MTAKVYTFKASDGSLDRGFDRINPNGWKLAGFRANPVILYGHDSGDGGPLGFGRRDVLPIGKGEVYFESNVLMVDVEFDQNDEFARRVEAKIEGGFLNAVSVRFRSTEFEPNGFGGLDFISAELLEISVVTIPANANATRAKAAVESGVAEGSTLLCGPGGGGISREAARERREKLQAQDFLEEFSKAMEAERFKREIRQIMGLPGACAWGSK